MCVSHRIGGWFRGRAELGLPLLGRRGRSVDDGGRSGPRESFAAAGDGAMAVPSEVEVVEEEEADAVLALAEPSSTARTRCANVSEHPVSDEHEVVALTFTTMRTFELPPRLSCSTCVSA